MLDTGRSILLHKNGSNRVKLASLSRIIFDQTQTQPDPLVWQVYLWMRSQNTCHISLWISYFPANYLSLIGPKFYGSVFRETKSVIKVSIHPYLGVMESEHFWQFLKFMEIGSYFLSQYLSNFHEQDKDIDSRNDRESFKPRSGFQTSKKFGSAYGFQAFHLGWLLFLILMKWKLEKDEPPRRWPKRRKRKVGTAKESCK